MSIRPIDADNHDDEPLTLLGSDWPHGEGVAEPLDFASELAPFGELEKARLLRDNCLELLGRPVAS